MSGRGLRRLGVRGLRVSGLGFRVWGGCYLEVHG